MVSMSAHMHPHIRIWIYVPVYVYVWRGQMYAFSPLVLLHGLGFA